MSVWSSDACIYFISLFKKSSIEEILHEIKSYDRYILENNDYIENIFMYADSEEEGEDLTATCLETIEYYKKAKDLALKELELRKIDTCDEKEAFAIIDAYRYFIDLKAKAIIHCKVKQHEKEFGLYRLNDLELRYYKVQYEATLNCLGLSELELGIRTLHYYTRSAVRSKMQYIETFFEEILSKKLEYTIRNDIKFRNAYPDNPDAIFTIFRLDPSYIEELRRKGCNSRDAEVLNSYSRILSSNF